MTKTGNGNQEKGKVLNDVVCMEKVEKILWAVRLLTAVVFFLVGQRIELLLLLALGVTVCVAGFALEACNTAMLRCAMEC